MRVKNGILFEAGLHLLVLLFLYTGFSKLLDYSGFRAAMFKSPPLRPWAGTIAWALPVVEVVIGGALLAQRFRLQALIASAFLLLGVTGYLGYMIVYSPHLPCNCGGVIGSLSWPQHLVFNLFFIFLNILLLWRHKKYSTRGEPLERTLSGRQVTS